jgi:hypothetical protein
VCLLCFVLLVFHLSAFVVAGYVQCYCSKISDWCIVRGLAVYVQCYCSKISDWCIVRGLAVYVQCYCSKISDWCIVRGIDRKQSWLDVGLTSQ